MSRLRVAIAASGLSAEVSVTAGAKATTQDLAAELAAAGVVHGIDQAAVAALGARLADPAFTGKATVARGQPPQPGSEGFIDLAFAGSRRSGTTLADGRIDFRERDLLPPAVAGQEVGRLVAPVAGAPGRDVRGRELRAPPAKPFAPRLGPGVQGGTGGGVVAVRAGVVLVNGTKLIDVVDLWRHEADVDLRSGNLHTHGSLLVTGDLREGGTITAGGDVILGGAVLDGTVRAGGNATIAQGVMGEQSVLIAGGDVHVHHATAAVLCADGVLQIDAQLAHCWARAERIELVAGRGQAFGGELRARESISLLVAGTANGAGTQLAIGDLEPPERWLLRRSAARGQRSPPTAAQSTAAQSPAQSTVALPVPARGGALTREELCAGTIAVRGTCWPGVRIRIGNAVRDVHEPLHRVLFRWDPDNQGILTQELP